MKPSLLKSLIVAAGLISVMPGTGMAQSVGPSMETCPPSDPFAREFKRFAFQGPCRAISFDPYMAAERLDTLRSYYTGKLIRLRLAGRLAAQETALGIRPDQLEAWRAYTQATLAMVPDREALLTLIGSPDEESAGPEAFGRAEGLADVLTDYAEKAGFLKRAIIDLRAILDKEQLETARLPRLSLYGLN